jgi:hypothetical protein
LSLRTALLPALDAIDSILGPSTLDLSATRLTIITRSWDGGRRNSGSSVDGPVTEIPNWVPVRHVTQREIAGSGGRYEQGDVKVGPIRPAFGNQGYGCRSAGRRGRPPGAPVPTVLGASGGFTPEQLNPTVTEDGIEVIYRLTPNHPNTTGIAGDYQLLDFQRDQPFEFYLVVGRERTTP